jgi:UDP:flavonoid glycosyltransferase YjiC (YdhE family)
LWPKGDGKRIYAYFKPFPNLPRLLAVLNDLGCPTIIYGDGLDVLQRQFESNAMHFEREWLDLSRVGQECDLAILNGNHGTTVSLLMAGRPTLQIPIFLEQGLFSTCVERLGAALIVEPNKPEQFSTRLTALLTSSKFTEAAVNFARRYADFNPPRQIDAILQRAEELVDQ